MSKNSKVYRIHTPKGVKVLYEDSIKNSILCNGARLESLVRNSHVEPVPGNVIRFQIVWEEPFSRKFGRITRSDEFGNPFETRQSAVDREVAMILQQFYGIATCP